MNTNKILKDTSQENSFKWQGRKDEFIEEVLELVSTIQSNGVEHQTILDTLVDLCVESAPKRINIKGRKGSIS